MVPSRARAFRFGALIVAGLPVAGCNLGSAQSQAAASEDADTVSRAAGTMQGYTPGGVQVSLSTEPDPAEPGPLRLRFRLDPAPPDPAAVTVDLVAPRMPAHGIVRFPAHEQAGGTFASDVEIPMEGLWEIYVNLDRGREAASFAIEVMPTEGGHDHHGHGSVAAPEHGADLHHHSPNDRGTP